MDPGEAITVSGPDVGGEVLVKPDRCALLAGRLRGQDVHLSVSGPVGEFVQQAVPAAPGSRASSISVTWCRCANFARVSAGLPCSAVSWPPSCDASAA